MAVLDKDLGWQALQKEVRKFKGAVIKVGIQADAGVNTKAKVPALIYEYAKANEFGTDHIPARSFIRSTEKEKRTEWQERIRKGLDAVYDKKYTAVQVLSLVGISAVDDIKVKIDSIYTPPNAEETIKKKKSSKPLIDTGVMRNSIRYKLENV